MSTVMIIPRVLVICAIIAGNAFSQEQHVYRVTIRDGDRYYVQTGFRLKGTKGIITALHGVARADSIAAENKDRDFLGDLKVRFFNREQDLALLRSKELEQREALGLERSSTSPTEGLAVSIYGCPQGVMPKRTGFSFTVGPGVMLKIEERIPIFLRNEASARKSPAPESMALNIEGPLGPGYSGGPVLDSSGHVIAMADGGMALGYNLGWAILLNDPFWRDAEDDTRDLAELASLPRHESFFSSEETRGKVIADRRSSTNATPHTRKEAIRMAQQRLGQGFELKHNGKVFWSERLRYIALRNGYLCIAVFNSSPTASEGKKRLFEFKVSMEALEKAKLQILETDSDTVPFEAVKVSIDLDERRVIQSVLVDDEKEEREPKYFFGADFPVQDRSTAEEVIKILEMLPKLK